MAHSDKPNGGLRHAKGELTKQEAFGRGGNVKTGSTSGIQEEMHEAELLNNKGDVRCPYCQHLNHNAWEETRVCSNFGCSKKFKVKQKAKAAYY